MTTLTEVPPAEPAIAPQVETFADVLERLGGISADRVLSRPAPGTATEQDLLQLPDEIQTSDTTNPKGERGASAP